MGLDTVELVLAVEKAFEIRLDNGKLSECFTVGELYDLVLTEVRATHRPVSTIRARRAACASGRAFYCVRKAFMESCEVGRKQVTPGAALESLVPRKGRRKRWNDIAGALRCDLPPLKLPNRLFYGLLSGSVLIAICSLLLGPIQPVGAEGFWLIPGSLGLFVLSLTLTKPLAVEFASNCRTAGNLAEHITTYNWSQFAGANREWTDREVWERLRRLIAEQTGNGLERITAGATFVDDLRMD